MTLLQSQSYQFYPHYKHKVFSLLYLQFSIKNNAFNNISKILRKCLHIERYQRNFEYFVVLLHFVKFL